MKKYTSSHIIFLVLLSFLSILSISCKKETSANNNPGGNSHLNIQFAAVVDNDPLVAGKTYQNIFGEQYSVKTFKFYIHGVELNDSRTNSVVKLDKNDHYLINAIDAAGSLIIFNVPSSSYDKISFFIGVDSIRNTSGAQTGALDPALGMFWTWTTGYIMAKLEGTSPQAATPNNVIEYHIGGFKANETAIRRVSMNFPPGLQADLKNNGQSTLIIAANVNQWFHTPNSIRISQTPVAMTPGTLAKQVADNYAGMFTVVDIVNE